MSKKKNPVKVVEAPIETAVFIEAVTPLVEAIMKVAIPPYEENPKPGWVEFIAGMGDTQEVVQEIVAPTAPGQTGTAPLTRPQRRDERKWQQ